jgi:hypothetical protein
MAEKISEHKSTQTTSDTQWPSLRREFMSKQKYLLGWEVETHG